MRTRARHTIERMSERTNEQSVESSSWYEMRVCSSHTTAAAVAKGTAGTRGIAGAPEDRHCSLPHFVSIDAGAREVPSAASPLSAAGAGAGAHFNSPSFAHVTRGPRLNCRRRASGYPVCVQPEPSCCALAGPAEAVRRHCTHFAAHELRGGVEFLGPRACAASRPFVTSSCMRDPPDRFSHVRCCNKLAPHKVLGRRRAAHNQHVGNDVRGFDTQRVLKKRDYANVGSARPTGTTASWASRQLGRRALPCGRAGCGCQTNNQA